MTTTGTALRPIGECVLEIATWNPQRDGGDDEFCYVDLSAVNQATKTIESHARIPAKDAPSRARQLVRGGDILVSTVRPNLNGVARVPDSLDGATASTGFCVLRPESTKVLSEYLLHWVKTPAFVSDMTRKATGASYPAVSDRIICESMLPLPPLAEQQRIAAILDQAEALRADRRQAVVKLDTLTKSLFLELFGDPLMNPQSFPVHRLGDVCDVRDGTHDSPEYVDDGYPLVTSKNLTKGCVDLSEVNLISEEDFVEINRRSKVDQGDLLMPMIGTIGNPVLVNHQPDYAIKNVALIKFPPGAPSNIYVRSLLGGRYFDHVVSQRNRGGTQKFVSLGDIRGFPIPLPPKGLQERFGSLIAVMERLKFAQQTSHAKLDTLFASLQHRAFCGEL